MTDLNDFYPDLVGEGDFALAAQVMARAYVDSPAYRYIFSCPSLSGSVMDNEQRTEALQWMFERNVEIWSPHNILHGVFKKNGNDEERPKLLSCFVLEPQETPKIGLWDMLKAGFFFIPFRFGFGSMKRVLETKAWYDARMKKLEEIFSPVVEGKVCSLYRMVVLPEYQGKGIGSKFLSQQLRKPPAAGRVVVLSTQEHRNTVFYSRIGFETIHEEKFITKDGTEIPNWFMVYYPPELKEAVDLSALDFSPLNEIN